MQPEFVALPATGVNNPSPLPDPEVLVDARFRKDIKDIAANRSALFLEVRGHSTLGLRVQITYH